jgi:hypothetical protein
VPEAEAWRRCSACQKPIALGATYWVCNVSTCNRKRTGMVFCTVSCWEVHLPGANHRETWAVEKQAPKTAPPPEPARTTAATRERRRIVARPDAAPAPRETPQEVLIVSSRLKDYVHARSGFNTSDRVLQPLSEIVRRVCDRAIANAERDGRKTVLDRDIPDDAVR